MVKTFLAFADICFHSNKCINIDLQRKQIILKNNFIFCNVTAIDEHYVVMKMHSIYVEDYVETEYMVYAQAIEYLEQLELL